MNNFKNLHKAGNNLGSLQPVQRDLIEYMEHLEEILEKSQLRRGPRKVTIYKWARLSLEKRPFRPALKRSLQTRKFTHKFKKKRYPLKKYNKNITFNKVKPITSGILSKLNKGLKKSDS